MYAAHDDDLKPTSPPTCPDCNESKRLVWVSQETKIIVATKCKCGIKPYEGGKQ